LYGSLRVVKKFSGLQSKILKKLFTLENSFEKANFGALAFVRLYVPPAPVKVVRKIRMALRAGLFFCGSTCDWRGRDRDSALKFCAPGMFAEKGF